MISKLLNFLLIVLITVGILSCSTLSEKKTEPKLTKIQKKVAEYESVKLTTDLSKLSENQKKLLPLLIQAAEIIDEIFWKQAFGNKEELLNDIKGEDSLKFVLINYGPWDRLDGNKPFIQKYGNKPLGANFYPKDMTFSEFESSKANGKFSLYTLVKKDNKGLLYTVPYHSAYKEQIQKIAELLKQASELAENKEFKKYLQLRADALLTDKYSKSDLAWINLKDNIVDLIIGPIQDIEDRLFGAKAAHDALLLIKDIESSKKLEKFALILPYLQKSLPVDDKYKAESPGEASNIGVYDVIYNSGYSNAGSKLISVNLPVDIYMNITQGNKKLHFKNIIKAKFDKILLPISDIVIDEDQRKHVTSDAFFQNSIFWEIADGLGIQNTINNKGTVKDALSEYYNIIETTKSEMLSLFFVTRLHDMGELDCNLMDNYVTYMASVFRSVRFGATDAQGKANMIKFYYFEEHGAFIRDEKTGTYKIDFDKMKEAMLSLSNEILVIQGDGNYDAAKTLVQKKGFIREDLYNDLVRIAKSRIPKDIVYEQGVDVLGL
ncbi:MAG: Zn-dependent hydrolase [Bacteroidales bacterium]|nr:Zn-dependent hydrolase [Bacteroidales bacterium]